MSQQGKQKKNKGRSSISGKRKMGKGAAAYPCTAPLRRFRFFFSFPQKKPSFRVLDTTTRQTAKRDTNRPFFHSTRNKSIIMPRKSTLDYKTRVAAAAQAYNLGQFSLIRA